MAAIAALAILGAGCVASEKSRYVQHLTAVVPQQHHGDGGPGPLDVFALDDGRAAPRSTLAPPAR